MKNKSELRNDIFSGVLLFLISFASIQMIANLLTSSYDVNQQHIIRPVFLFLLPLLAGIFTILSGYFLNLPYVILPNMMITILTVVYGRIYLGYSLSNVFLSVLIGTIIYVVFSLFITNKNWKHWIPQSFVDSFPFVAGGILLLFGLYKAGILSAVSSKEVALNLGDSIKMVDSQIPVFLGYILNPLSLSVLFGLCLYVVLRKHFPKYSLIVAFILIALVGFLIPIQWGNMQVKGKITEFNSFGFYGLKEGFVLLIANIKSITLPVIQKYFIILGKLLGLLKLSFLVFVTLTFQNLFVINTLDKVASEKVKLPGKVDKKELDQIEPVKSLPYRQMTLMNAISSFLGIFANLSSFSYSIESLILTYTNSATGMTAMICGILLLFSAFLSPIGILSSQSALPFLYILVGLSVAASQIKHIRFDSFSRWFPGFLFFFISIITMNPVEGLVVGIIFYVLITLIDNLYSTKEIVKIHPALWVSFVLSLLFVISQIKIEL